jgi:hypothetical protein
VAELLSETSCPKGKNPSASSGICSILLLSMSPTMKKL